jgi:hypothetical protein
MSNSPPTAKPTPLSHPQTTLSDNPANQTKENIYYIPPCGGLFFYSIAMPRQEQP